MNFRRVIRQSASHTRPFAGNCAIGLLGLALILSCALSTPTFAQQGDTAAPPAPYAFDGQIRYRLEVDNRFVADEARDSYQDVHLLRTRAGLTLRPVDDVEGYVQIQDSRSFGSEANTLEGSADMFDLHQGFVKIFDVFDSDVDVQVGRQEMAYANERLIGAVGWSNVGRSFDAVRASTDGDWGGVDLFAARLGQQSSDTMGQLFEFSSSNLYGAWSTVRISDDHHADLFALLDNNSKEIETGPDSGSAMQNRFTAGTFVRGSVSSLRYEGEFAWQGGSMFASDTLQSVAAMMASAKVSFVSSDATIGAFYTLLSGDDDPSDDQFKAFNTLFATNHKFYGFMDLFPRFSGTAGLQDIGVTSSLSLGEKTSVGLDAHLFLSAVDQNGENALGKEFDATFKHAYNSRLTLFGGLSAFLADALMKGSVGGEGGWWGFLGVSLN